MGLRDLRKASGRSVKDICAEIGISTATWYNWESDGWDPKNSQMKVISEVLKISVNVISENLDAPVSWPKVIDHRSYSLALLELDSIEEIPSGGRGLVILAKIRGRYHARIFDRFGVLMVSMDLLPDRELSSHLNCEIINSEAVVDLVTKALGYEDQGYTRCTLLMDTTAYQNLELVRELYEFDGGYTNKEIEPRANAIVIEKGIELLKQEFVDIAC